MSADGWFAVDFDGTLAHSDGGTLSLGAPIQAMVARVRKWVAAGREVRIFTARVASSGLTNKDGVVDTGGFAAEQRALIEAWCAEHLGVVLPVTATKDLNCVAIYDDRAVAVEKNTGGLVVSPSIVAREDFCYRMKRAFRQDAQYDSADLLVELNALLSEEP